MINYANLQRSLQRTQRRAITCASPPILYQTILRTPIPISIITVITLQIDQYPIPTNLLAFPFRYRIPSNTITRNAFTIQKLITRSTAEAICIIAVYRSSE